MKANKKLIKALDGDDCIFWQDVDWWVELDKDKTVSSIRCGQYALERNSSDSDYLEPGYLGWGGDTEFMWDDDYNYNPNGDLETLRAWIDVWQEFPVADFRNFLKEFGKDTKEDEKQIDYLVNDYLPRLLQDEEELEEEEEEDEDE